MNSMGNFNRGRQGGPARYASRSDAGGGRGFSAKGGPASGWERRGPAQMHQAVCDNCKKNCEVPFRPTSGKPIFCSNCFERSRGSDSRPANFEEKRMFEAVCDECGNSCKVPFQPRGDKPIYCSNCFGEKKGAGSRELEVLNNKLDRILQLLNPQPQEQSVATEETKVVKKRSPKKS